MLHKLGAWAWIGGASLAAIAGMVNAVGLLGSGHQAVTHLSGTTTLLSVALEEFSLPAVLHLCGILLAFLAGAILSGFIIRRQTLKLGRRYGAALAIEGCLLFVAALLLRRDHMSGAWFAASAAGLQNAMATTYSGAILRTTHVTGIVTDIGSALGHALRGIEIDRARLRLHLLVLAGFLLGGVVGAALFRRHGADALFFPAGLTFAVAIVYSLYAHFRREDSATA